MERQWSGWAPVAISSEELLNTCDTRLMPHVRSIAVSVALWTSSWTSGAERESSLKSLDVRP
eukprot:11185928-Lingulodinium_polyedra.AAC.1